MSLEWHDSQLTVPLDRAAGEPFALDRRVIVTGIARTDGEKDEGFRADVYRTMTPGGRDVGYGPWLHLDHAELIIRLHEEQPTATESNVNLRSVGGLMVVALRCLLYTSDAADE